jgi:chaperone required for assembly of F1-ATPase
MRQVMKRFWTETSIAEAAGSYTLLLDGKPMRLPGGPALQLSHRALAEAIAAEWTAVPPGAALQPALLPMTQLAATAQLLQPALLPMTQLAATAQLRIPATREETAIAIAAYGQSDLLCYRATEPAELVLRQETLWQPWLDWALMRHEVRLRVTAGIGFVDQPAPSLAALSQAVAAHDDHGLAALGVLVPLLGSVVLGLAVTDGALTGTQAHALSVLDEVFQEERWGPDQDAAAGRAQKAAEAQDAARYFMLTRSAG